MTHPSPYHAEIKGGICISVAAADTGTTINLIKPLEKDIDVVEIRIDAMQQFSIPELCMKVKSPLLFTNRPEWEGGNFTGPEKERLDPLLQAVQNQAAFVDLELKTSLEYREQLLAEIHGSGTRMIISYHDFSGTPDSTELSAILLEQISSGAHIGKIVTTAHSHLDVLRVLHLQYEANNKDFPLIAFCMGEAGKLSRIITLLLGGFMTYAAIDEKQATAPGQLSLQQLKTAMDAVSSSSVKG